jgi:hypothetical protein
MLDLSYTRVGNAALENFKGLDKLGWLFIPRTKTTAAGAQSLRVARPDLEVLR